MRRQRLSWTIVLFVLLGLALPASTRAQGVADPDKSDDPISLETDPLEARFGGTRVSFEDAYGEPSKPEAGKYPRGDDYQIDGYKRVSVFYHEDRIVHISLFAPADDFWTTKQADDARADFLPSDAKLGTAVETADGEPLVRAKSKALAEEIEQEIYDTYKAKGKPGDLSVTYQLDKRKRVKAIDVELGRVSTSSQNDADAEKTYLKALRGQFDVLAASMDVFEQTLAGVQDGSIDAQTGFQRLLTAWIVWRQADVDAKTLKPPTSQQGTQDLYLQLTGLLATAADEFQNGLVNNDSSLLQSGDTKYAQARLFRILIQSTLEGAGV
ncbi:MAG TPA: hypothetical protein VKB09_06210 [Thermomicrobiales bacterium]|nr:hypothetical protein [Thermomicrobiales bacterium]